MFLSINRKIIYSIFIFFIVTGIIFLCTFYTLYLHKTSESQNEIFRRNNQYVSMLYENFLLKKTIQNFYTTNKTHKRDPLISSILKHNSLQKNEKNISTEKDRSNLQLSKLNERYETLNEAAKILLFSSVFILLSGIMLWYLMKIWVISPIQKLSLVSKEVIQNNLSTRIEMDDKKKFFDEFYDLNSTFNSMLDRLEKNISEVKEKEQFLQSLIDTIPDGIRVIDKDYNIIIANKEYYQSFEKQKQSCKCYASLKDAKTKCNQTKERCPVYELLIHGKDNIKNKIITSFNDKHKKYIAINAAPLQLSDGTKYVVESLRDLSEDIKFSYNQKLSSIGFLATSVSHEMKNNLGAIRMILESVITKTKDENITREKTIEYMKMIHNQIIKSIDVPKRLLKLTQTSNKKELINCIEEIKDTIALLDYQAKSKGVLLNFNHSDKEIFIKVLSNEFRMVIINLLQNAIQAIDKQGNIIIQCFRDNKNVTIKIKDNGIGIKKHNLNFIFDPFFSDAQSKKENSSGLGLTVAKSFIEKFGGEIKVYSKEKVGTTFAITFPLQKKDLQI